MAVKKTVQIGDSLLYQKAVTIKKFDSQYIKELVIDLRDTMRSLQLSGFAAPQIGVMERVFITEVRKTKYRTENLDRLRVYMNPKITWFSKKEVKMYEGCGSILHANLFGEVQRPEKIEVSYFDESNVNHIEKFDGFLARVIQHEYDHLNGILFTEKLTDPRTLVDREHYMKLMGRV